MVPAAQRPSVESPSPHQNITHSTAMMPLLVRRSPAFCNAPLSTFSKSFRPAKNIQFLTASTASLISRTFTSSSAEMGPPVFFDIEWKPPGAGKSDDRKYLVHCSSLKRHPPMISLLPPGCANPSLTGSLGCSRKRPDHISSLRRCSPENDQELS